MQLLHCTHDRHARAILDILNDAILNSTALYDYTTRSIDSMAPWFEEKASNRFPVIGVEQAGRLLGFATYGTFRARPAYKYSVEHSVYVEKEHRGRGVGLMLMRHLIEVATEQDYHVMVAGIDVSNTASISLHQRLGFVHAGTLTQVGFKFGRWLDLAFYQLTLTTPASPVDGVA
jgi:L-amino acid N-acyltransferase YncA